jgi:hypothetical protein
MSRGSTRRKVAAKADVANATSGYRHRTFGTQGDVQGQAWPTPTLARNAESVPGSVGAAVVNMCAGICVPLRRSRVAVCRSVDAYCVGPACQWLRLLAWLGRLARDITCTDIDISCSIAITLVSGSPWRGVQHKPGHLCTRVAATQTGTASGALRTFGYPAPSPPRRSWPSPSTAASAASIRTSSP